MDAIEYLHNLGNELSGLNDDPKARSEVLAYAKDRLESGLSYIADEMEAADGN